MFAPNKHSFLLVRSANLKPSIESGIQEQRTTSFQSSALLDYDKSIFLPNKYSFLLVRSASSESIVESYIQDQTTSLPPSSSLDTRDLSRLTLDPSKLTLDSGKPTIEDKNKRIFLKIAGIAGASIVASLLLPKKAEALIMGSAPTTGVVGVKDSTNARINPATEETLSTLLKTSDLSFDAGALNVKVDSLPSGSFSDSGDVSKSGLVDADRHVQVDVLSSALPTSASTETTLQTISFGGFKFTCHLATVGSVDYMGEAAVGTATSAAAWRIKKIDSTTGIVIQWAGTGIFDQVWDNYASLSYS